MMRAERCTGRRAGARDGRVCLSCAAAVTVDVVTRTSDATIGPKGLAGVLAVGLKERAICGLLHVRRGRRERYESNEGETCAVANGRQGVLLLRW